MKIPAMVLSVGLLVGSPATGSAQTTTTELNTQAATMNNLSQSKGETNVTNKISSDFSSFLGSDANAIVTGLRNGTPIKLTSITTTPSTTPGGTPTTTTTNTTIIPPTGHMGFGNVYISLALAKQQLNTLGIAEPTPQQLQTALTGGTITQTTGTGTTATSTTTKLQGILTMRSQNMGWGQIAQKLGFKLGPVISGMKSANQNLANSATSSGAKTTTASRQSSESTGNDSVSGSGPSHGNSGKGISSGTGSGSGIVTASGRSGNGNAYGNGRSGIVTGSGRATSSAGGVVSAGGGGQGNGQGKGHTK